MNKIYCELNTRNTEQLDFYITTSDGRRIYLLSQKYYESLEDYFGNGVSLDDALDHSKGGCYISIHKVKSKLPAYIRYAEQEYGVAILNKTRRRLEKSA